MTGNCDFRIRPGRNRSTRSPRPKSFLAQALKAAQKSGGLSRGGQRRDSRFGRGRAASLAASRLLNNRARSAIVKARVVRRMRSPGAVRAPTSVISSAMGLPGTGRLGSCSMPPETRPMAAGSPNAARAMGIISGSSSHPMMPASSEACGASRVNLWIRPHRPLEHRASPCPHPCARPHR
jgi:hypothetical protein